MDKFAKSNMELGDIHAPVEDTNVPLTLKLLVVFMVLVVGGLGTLIGIVVSQLR